MTPNRGHALLLGTLLAVGGCAQGADTNPDAMTGPCIGQAEICPTAIALADAQLGWLHWPVTSTEFRASMCPPNARCAFTGSNQGWVIFTFLVGDPLMIHVGTADALGTVAAGLVAGDPEPPPEWLLLQMAGIKLDPER